MLSAEPSLRSSAPPAAKFVQLLLALAHAPVQGVEPAHGILGHERLRSQGGQFVVHGRPPPPRFAQSDGQLDHPQLIVRAGFFFLEPGDFAVEQQSLAGQLAIAAHEVVELFDVLAEFFPFGQQLGDLAGAAAAVEDAIARGFQFAQHVDQRDAIHARAEIVKELGGVADSPLVVYEDFPVPGFCPAEGVWPPPDSRRNWFPER